MLRQFRTASFGKVRARLPAVRALYPEMRVFFASDAESKQHTLPEGVQTGVRGGAEYCNAGYLCLEGDKEYMTLRRRGRACSA